MRFTNKITYAIIISILIIISIIFIIVFPEKWVYGFYPNYELNIKLQLIKEFRSTIIQIVTGILAIIALYLTWRRTNALDIQNKNAESQLNILDKKNSIDKDASTNNLILQQYSIASELLSNDNIVSRLSGIYLFEKIMNSNKDYYINIIELLTSYIRDKRKNENFFVNLDNFKKDNLNENLKFYTNYDFKNLRFGIWEDYDKINYFYSVPITMDIQAILEVIGRSNKNLLNTNNSKIKYEELIKFLEEAIMNNNSELVEFYSAELNKFNKINLSNLNLNGCNLSNLNFDNTNFDGTHIVNSNCNNTSFINSSLGGACFSKSSFSHANFSKIFGININFIKSILTHTNFSYANAFQSKFNDCNCQEAIFKYTNLFFTDFSISNLIYSDFSNSNISYSRFQNINFSEVKFDNAIIKKVDFTNNRKLTNLQLEKAKEFEDLLGV